MAEAQSDVTIRGDTFENTGLKVGALSIFDPQTGHYLMELPVAPAMLGAPGILTGADLAEGVMNATGGAVDYGWRPVAGSGFASAAIGNDGLGREELYDGLAGAGAAHLAATPTGRTRRGTARCRSGTSILTAPMPALSGLRRARRPTRSWGTRRASSAGRTCTRRSTRTRLRTSRPCLPWSATGRTSGEGTTSRRALLPAKQGRLRL